LVVAAVGVPAQAQRAVAERRRKTCGPEIRRLAHVAVGVDDEVRASRHAGTLHDPCSRRQRPWTSGGGPPRVGGVCATAVRGRCTFLRLAEGVSCPRRSALTSAAQVVYRPCSTSPSDGRGPQLQSELT